MQIFIWNFNILRNSTPFEFQENDYNREIAYFNGHWKKSVGFNENKKKSLGKSFEIFYNKKSNFKSQLIIWISREYMMRLKLKCFYPYLFAFN